MVVDDLSDFVPKSGKLGLRRSSVRTGGIGLAIAWGMILAVVVFAVPKFEGIFRDFGVELGGLTKLVVWASHASIEFGLAILVLLGFNQFMSDQLSTGKDGGPGIRAWSSLMLVLPLGAVLLLVVALGLPIVGLISKLSG